MNMALLTQDRPMRRFLAGVAKISGSVPAFFLNDLQPAKKAKLKNYRLKKPSLDPLISIDKIRIPIQGYLEKSSPPAVQQFSISLNSVRVILRNSQNAAERLKADEAVVMTPIVESDVLSAFADYASGLAWRGVRERFAITRDGSSWVADEQLWFILRDCLVLDPNKVSLVLSALMTDSFGSCNNEFRFSWGRIVRTEEGLKVISTVKIRNPPQSDAQALF